MARGAKPEPGRTVQLNMRIDAGLKERLAEYCADTGQSMTVAISRCLNRALDEYFEKKARKGAREPW